jgi:branched-chain amino acid transport system substrate-binding protein
MFGTRESRRRRRLRGLIVLQLAAALSLNSVASRLARAADPQTVSIALIAPLSGDWGEQGVLMREGAEFAVDEINSQGGVKSLGGAKLKLAVADTGNSVETAVSAAQRVLGSGEVSAAVGCWLSSFTLATTEIAERVHVPWVTFSYADKVTARGYKYTFRDNAPSSQQVSQGLKEVLEASAVAGHPIKTLAIATDNTAAAQAGITAIKKYAPELGLKIVAQEVWTPPLSDPDSIASAIKDANPDLIWGGATTLSDTSGLVQALHAHKVSTPMLGAGSQFLTEAFIKAVGGSDKVNGLATIVGDGVLKGMESLNDKFEAAHHHPMIEDMADTYAEVWIIKEAIEKAASADPQKIRDALASLDVTTGPASFVPGGEVKFDETGQNSKAEVAIQQWQDGKIITVAPPNAAVGKLIPLR